jgi:hypothetical protein
MAYLPDEAEEWPFEAKRSAVASANSAAEIREDIDTIVGLRSEWAETGALSFTKHEAAAILLALGGPNGGED